MRSRRLPDRNRIPIWERSNTRSDEQVHYILCWIGSGVIGSTGLGLAFLVLLFVPSSLFKLVFLANIAFLTAWCVWAIFLTESGLEIFLVLIGLVIPLVWLSFAVRRPDRYGLPFLILVGGQVAFGVGTFITSGNLPNSANNNVAAVPTLFPGNQDQNQPPRAQPQNPAPQDRPPPNLPREPRRDPAKEQPVKEPDIPGITVGLPSLAEATGERVHLVHLAGFEVRNGGSWDSKDGAAWQTAKGLRMGNPNTGYWQPGMPAKVGKQAILRGVTMACKPPNAWGAVKFRLGRQGQQLSGTVGLSDLMTIPGPQVYFIVAGDGRTLWQSRAFTAAGSTEAFDVDVTGVDVVELALVTNEPANRAGNAGIWIDPVVTRLNKPGL